MLPMYVYGGATRPHPPTQYWSAHAVARGHSAEEGSGPAFTARVHACVYMRIPLSPSQCVRLSLFLSVRT
jgi:hypothetical protein